MSEPTNLISELREEITEELDKELWNEFYIKLFEPELISNQLLEKNADDPEENEEIGEKLSDLMYYISDLVNETITNNFGSFKLILFSELPNYSPFRIKMSQGDFTSKRKDRNCIISFSFFDSRTKNKKRFSFRQTVKIFYLLTMLKPIEEYLISKEMGIIHEQLIKQDSGKFRLIVGDDKHNKIVFKEIIEKSVISVRTNPPYDEPIYINILQVLKNCWES